MLARTNLKKLGHHALRLFGRSNGEPADFASDDVFVVGYPKSGNTWFQNLVAGVVYGLSPRYAPFQLIQDLVPDVHYKKSFTRYLPVMVFKTHHLPRPEYRRVVYLLRDGRDVMASYFHHLRALNQGRDISFLKMVRDGGLFPCKWHQHVEEWLFSDYKHDLLIIRYEHLIRDTVRELERFCSFSGFNRLTTVLQSVAEQCSFKEMRKREIEFGWGHPAWPRDQHFIRRGHIGSFRDEMPPEVLDAFLRDSSGTLKRCGYLNVRDEIPARGAP